MERDSRGERAVRRAFFASASVDPLSGEVEPICCEGAPRGLGLDQGRMARAALRAEFGALAWWRRGSLWAGARDPHTSRAARDLRRHFPHQAEVLEGIRAAARVPRSWLEGKLAAEFARRERGGADREPLAVAAAESLTLGGSLLLCGLAGDEVVRRSRPEGGFASIEVTRPWLPCALAGINEQGLAVAALPGGFEAGDCAVSGVLLAQDCLQRFADLEAFLDWGLGRPAAGWATLVAADARGEVAAVRLAAGGRRVLRPADGLIVEVGRAGLGEECAKALRGATRFGFADLARLLLAEGERAELLVGFEPCERRLTLARASSELRSFDV